MIFTTVISGFIGQLATTTESSEQACCIAFAALHNVGKQLTEVASTYVSLNAEHIHMQYFE